MNIKSFFNGTILKKDLTRFLPLWAIYLIMGFVVAFQSLGARYDSATELLLNSLRLMSFVVCIYALVAAQLLFGELFSGRHCNAIHAFPVRREGLFITHYTAGLIMGIVPILISAPIAMISMGNFWQYALLWVAGIAMLFLLFFGMAVFCMLCSGNRIAGVTLYGLTNIISVVGLWFFESFFLPMLYGLQMDKSLKADFYQFSPVIRCMKEYEWINIQHSTKCPSSQHYSGACLFEIEGLGDIWNYLGILAVVGIGFAVAALLLYRSRKLENAGDFMAFKSLGAVFTVLTCLCLGALCCRIMGSSFIGMPVGVVIGFFVCRMLLERKIKVFRGKNWLKLGILSAALTLSLVGVYQISLHITNQIPKSENIVSVTITERELSDYQLESIRLAGAQSPGQYENYAFFGFPQALGNMRLVTDCQIEDMRQIHKMLLEEGDVSKKNHTSHDLLYIAVHYLMQDGSITSRHYYIHSESPILEQLNGYRNTPEYALGTESWDTIMDNLQAIYLNKTQITDPVILAKLTDALLADAEHWQKVTSNIGEYHFQLVYALEGEQRSFSFFISDGAKALNILSWIQAYRIEQIMSLSIDNLILYLQYIHIDGSSHEDDWERLFLEALYADYAAGKLVPDMTQPARIALSLGDENGKTHRIPLYIQLDGTQTLDAINGYSTWLEAYNNKQNADREEYLLGRLFENGVIPVLSRLLEVYIDGQPLPDDAKKAQWDKRLLEALYTDFQSGKLVFDMKQPLRIELVVKDRFGYRTTYELHLQLKDTQTLEVLNEYLGSLYNPL